MQLIEKKEKYVIVLKNKNFYKVSYYDMVEDYHNLPANKQVWFQVERQEFLYSTNDPAEKGKWCEVTEFIPPADMTDKTLLELLEVIHEDSFKKICGLTEITYNLYQYAKEKNIQIKIKKENSKLCVELDNRFFFEIRNQKRFYTIERLFGSVIIRFKKIKFLKAFIDNLMKCYY